MSFKQTLIASGIMILTAILLYFMSHGENIHPNKPFSDFPKQIHGWKGKEEYFDKQILEVLGVDDYILCNYHMPKDRFIQLYVGFYQSQREGDLIHSPKNCMPGSGWNIIETEIETVDISPVDSGQQPESTEKMANFQGEATYGQRTGKSDHKINVIKLVTQKGTYKQIVLYWFQSRGRIISSEYMQKIWLVIDSITRRRTDGSFVRLTAPVINDEQATLNQMQEFVRQLMPILQEYIPS
jgi:hypothetical protein